MKIENIAINAVALVLVAGMAMPASALMVNGATDTSVDVSTSLTNAANVDASVNASGSASSSTGSASASGSAGIGSEVSSSAETILVTRADFDKGEVIVSTTNAASVNNASEIRSYIAAELQNDANLESVEVADEAVQVTYKQKARLFAVIPVKVKATASVRADGTVEVSYPWYSFLMSTNKAELESKIESRVSDIVDAMIDLETALAAEGSVSPSGNTSANIDAEMAARVSSRAQAMLVSEVKAVMAEALAEAGADADVKANANASANVQ